MSDSTIDNIANTRRGFEAFGSGDLDALRELLDPDIVWHVPGRSSLSGDYRGIDATLGYFLALFERSGGTFKAELLECGEIAPDLVACLVRLSGDMSAACIDLRAMMLFQERDGRSVEVWNFSSDQYAIDEAEGPVAIALPDARSAEAPVTA
jgi:ketosteroid isomerase-like protein